MTLTVDAIYENGTLKLEQPLPLRDQEKVRVTVNTQPSVAQQTAGLIAWGGDHESLEQFVRDPELDPQAAI